MAVAMALIAIWVEGENYKTAPQALERNVGLKAPASGGKVLYGENFAKQGNVVSYEFDLPADLKDARVIFRYARPYQKAASIELAVSGPGGDVKKELALTQTNPGNGWGTLAKEYKLFSMDVGDLKKGKHTLKLTALAPGSDTTIDGFFVAAKDFQVTEEELNQCCRIQIAPEGYVGLARPADTVRQDLEPGIKLAVRSFSGKKDHELAWSLTKTGGSAKGEQAILKTTDPYPTLQPTRFSDLEDGTYKLTVSCKDPACQIEEDVLLCGKLLSVLGDRLKPVKDFTADLATKQDPKGQRALSDLQHIVQYLEDNGKKFSGGGAAEESADKKRLAALEGVEAPDALIGDMRRAADQAEKMIANLKAGKDAYDGMAGDLRRAYRSVGDGNLVPYRVFLPDAYAKQDKVPFLYMLHGGGGDENSFPDTEGGKILEILNKRGYVAVCPRWNSRGRPAGDVLQLLELTLKEYPKIDPDRVYCTGLSMGGFGTYNLATEHPEFFAAVCCVSGTGDPAKAEKLKNVPLQIFQGAGDPVVNPAGAERVAARMKELGYVVDLHMFPKYGHDYHAEEYLNLSIDFFGKYTRKRE
jgi:dienelactone hydrolase